MLVASCSVTLRLHSAHSLKDKRRVVKSVLARLPQQFNVAVAEVDSQDVWQTAVIGLVTIGTDAGYLHGLLERSVAWIEKQRPDVEIERYQIEFR
jgi:uncharacterized protein